MFCPAPAGNVATAAPTLWMRTQHPAFSSAPALRSRARVPRLPPTRFAPAFNIGLRRAAQTSVGPAAARLHRRRAAS
eukprot:278191-Chlamydomonas_euryale.AAC.7